MGNPELKLSPSVKIRTEKFGAMLFDKAREQYFVVDEVGKDILECLKDGDNLNEILARLRNIYEASPEVMEEDIKKFIDDLKTANLLVN